MYLQGASFMDFMILEALLHKGPLTTSVIGSKIAQLPNAPMRQAIDRMNRRGLIRRQENRNGASKDVFELTDEGYKQITKLYEQPGYILNSLMIPLLEAAQVLLLNEVADVETIDKTWMIATGAPEGPFAILDTVGINTTYNIILAKANATSSPEFEKLAYLLKTEYLDKGKRGRATGQGFYTYPNPSFARPDFLRSQ